MILLKLGINHEIPFPPIIHSFFRKIKDGEGYLTKIKLVTLTLSHIRTERISPKEDKGLESLFTIWNLITISQVG
ncbi:hypothetical protein GCM10027164_11580 [Algoriphagus taiwanensis]